MYYEDKEDRSFMCGSNKYNTMLTRPTPRGMGDGNISGVFRSDLKLSRDKQFTSKNQLRLTLKT